MRAEHIGGAATPEILGAAAPPMRLSALHSENINDRAVTLLDMTDNYGNPQNDAQHDHDAQEQHSSGSAQQPYEQQASYAQQSYGQAPFSPQQPNPQYPNGNNPYAQQQPQQAQYDPRLGNQGAYGPNTQQPYTPRPGYAPYPNYVVAEPQTPWNITAIIGFVLSFFFAPAGLVVSIIALVQIRKTHEHGNGLAIAGTVVGAVFTILAALFIAFVIWGIGLAASSEYSYYSNPSCSSYGCYSDEGSDTLDSSLRTYLDNANTAQTTELSPTAR